MAESKTQICNLALSHIGSAKDIADIDSDQSQEARACRTFFEQANKEMQREFLWTFNTRIRELSLVESDPTSEWAYSYRYPSDCLFARRVLSGVRQDSRESRVPYRVVSDDDGKLIYTDMEEAELEYGIYEDDVTRYPPDYVMSLSYRLAFYVAPRVSKGDPFKFADKAMELYKMSVSLAQNAAFNEQQADVDLDGEFVRVRE